MATPTSGSVQFLEITRARNEFIVATSPSNVSFCRPLKHSLTIIPEAAISACTRVFDALWRLSGIHNPCRADAEIAGLWIPGSGVRPAPE
jgi:hypothetical protein